MEATSGVAVVVSVSQLGTRTPPVIISPSSGPDKDLDITDGVESVQCSQPGLSDVRGATGKIQSSGRVRVRLTRSDQQSNEISYFF